MNKHDKLSTSYNGYPSWAQWNVSLWLNNDEGLYKIMRDCVRMADNRPEACTLVMDILEHWGMTHTPDGARITKTAILGAMRGI